MNILACMLPDCIILFLLVIEVVKVFDLVLCFLIRLTPVQFALCALEKKGRFMQIGGIEEGEEGT